MAGDPPPSDEELVRRVVAGDTAAAALLFDRHLPALRAAVRRRLPPGVRAKLGESDVIQDAYLAAFLDLRKFEDRGDGSFGRWLRRIVESKVANGVRGHVAAGKRDVRREVRLTTSPGGVNPARRQRSPSEVAMAGEDASAVRASVDALPEDYRAVIQHVHRDGLTLVDAAACMGRSPDAVRKLYGRAVARLAEQMRAPAGPAA